MKNNYKQKGFTLIELLVVIGIIAVLTAMATFNFNQSRIRARDIQRKNDLKQLQSALELYKNDAGMYPAGTTLDELNTALIGGNYIKAGFTDPKEGQMVGSWDQYKYNRVSNISYTLSTCFENTADPQITSPVVKCGPLPTNDAGRIYQVTEP